MSMISGFGISLFITLAALACNPVAQIKSVSDDFSYPDSPVTVEIAQIQLSSCICGVVENAQGDRLEGALVEIINEQSKKRMLATLSDSNGQFHMSLGIGEMKPYLLKIGKPGFDSVVMRVRIDAKTMKKLTIRLPFSA